MPNTFSKAEFFNKELKGKYAYFIKMRYIFPLDSLNYSEYVNYEQLDDIKFLSSDIKPHLDSFSSNFINEYIDITSTECANNINKFIISNKYTTDHDLDITSIKLFRTWLAEQLLIIYSNELSNKQLHMLEFYKNGMYSEVLKYLDYFGDNKYTNTSNVDYYNFTPCGCCNTTIVNTMDELNTNLCDVKTIYINNIHKLMVETFKQPSFWINTNVDFIKVFKKYIDNIIKSGLVVETTTEENTPYIDCICTSNKTTTQFEKILNNLSISLEYIINNDYNGHLNFIHDSLYMWAEHLYDKMFW